MSVYVDRLREHRSRSRCGERRGDCAVAHMGDGDA